jgi:hypothetical protein
LAWRKVGDLVEGRVVERDVRPCIAPAPGPGALLRGHLLQLGPGVLVEVEERGHGPGELRLGGEVLEVLGVDLQRLEERLVEELGQGLVDRAPARASP